jgi:putative ABC transport system substrate-binding protein
MAERFPWLLVSILVLGAIVTPAVNAQPAGPTRRIGVLMAFAESDPQAQARVAAFRAELQKLGWEEGRNIRIDIRWATTSDGASMQRFAAEVVALQPDLILSHNTPTTAALLRHTRTIPIVFATVSDPVGSGFVASIARPGGHVTGFTNIEPSMAGKWLELLKQIAPRVTRVAFLFNPATAPYADRFFGSLQGGRGVLRLGGDCRPRARSLGARSRACRPRPRAEQRSCRVD